MTESTATRMPAPHSLILGALVLGTGIGGLFGLPSWVPIVVASVPWVLFARARWGAALAVVVVIVLDLWALFLLMMITERAHLPMLPTALAAVTLAGLVGCLAIARSRFATFTVGFERNVWIASAIGPVVWIVSILLSTVVPGAARYLWVMSNDSANNMLFARQIVYSGGIAVGFNQNPVPLPTGLMALVMSSGRHRVDAADLLRHDVGALVQVWTIVIALFCFLAGVLVARLVRASTDRRPVVIVAAAAGSLIPLSWFFTSYPVDYGFLSTHVAIVIILASVIAALSSSAHPHIALALQCFAATCLLAVWSPLVAIPALLAAAIIVANWRRFLVWRSLGTAFVALGIIQLAVYGLLVTVPSFLTLRAFLQAAGGVYAFPHWMLPALALAAVVLSAVAFWRTRRVMVVVIVGLAIGSLLGLAGLLLITRRAPDPWTYYPTKYAWVASTTLALVVLALLVSVLARTFAHRWGRVAALGLIVVITAGTVIAAPPSDKLHTWRQPIAWILGGSVNGDGDEVADRILDAANLEKPAIYWQSGNPHQLFINFWLLEIAANSMTDSNALRVASYGGYHEKRIGDLCSLMTTLGGHVRVHTASVTLRSEIASACPTLDARVIVGR
ncbi:hypothetical protein BH09ACT1_BH09ACT1_02320 [soil metagenome]